MVDWWADPVTGGVAKFAYDKYQDLKHENELDNAYKRGWHDSLVDSRKRNFLDDVHNDTYPDDPFFEGDPNDNDIWK